jgi:predicted HicB family RNase H-like nuclease
VSSPQIVVRVTPGLKRDAAQLAAKKGLSLSELTRQALDEFVKRAG